MSAPVCPECAADKHLNCNGDALDEDTDQVVACVCCVSDVAEHW